MKLQRLHKNGARKFWIHGTGALGCMPQKLAMPRDDDSGLDEHGCIASINNVCKKFNSLLSEALDELRLTLKKSAIVFVDMFAIKYDLVANHKKYGKLIFHYSFLLSVFNSGSFFNTGTISQTQELCHAKNILFLNLSRAENY